MRIAVLYGGNSPEREVSLRSGKAVADALKRNRHKVILLDPAKKNFAKKIIEVKPDCVFIALHGEKGEDGIIQGFLETIGIPYTGSDVRASAICMNKIIAKKLLIYHKIPTPMFVELDKENPVTPPFPFPVVVKPANMGSTIGIKIVKNKKEMVNAIKECFKLDSQVFIEEYIKGTEVTAGILGNEKPEVLPVIEIETPTGFYDYKAKYTPGGSRHIIPARIDKKILKKIEDMALLTYKILGCSGFARMEMIVKKGIPYILDVNTIPGMTDTSLFPDAAKAKGISFDELCERIVMFGLERWQKQKRG
ncbi:MAG TPA: D-alanine--D-alanine ligase [bacterium]|nr:D-alanine--D-alanine ligase [bacterium]HPP29584.1 D-alanine--D-alanine ligase [bacterium]